MKKSVDYCHCEMYLEFHGWQNVSSAFQSLWREVVNRTQVVLVIKCEDITANLFPGMKWGFMANKMLFLLGRLIGVAGFTF